MIPVIPVLDVMNGVVVHAKGGRRNEYRPIESLLTKSTEPLDVLKALIDVTGSDVAYVADLNAIISGGRPSEEVLDLAERASVRLWIDFGIRTGTRLIYVPGRKQIVPVIGTETMENFEVVRTAHQFFHHVIGSIDCFGPQTIGRHQNQSALSLAQSFVEIGYQNLIVLDLAAVGSTGNDCLDRVERLTSLAEISGLLPPDGKLYAGGGIRNRDDLRLFEQAGCTGVLVASALHDGTLP